MKEGIHPNYREVVFQDMASDFRFITRSTVSTREKITVDGKEYPLFKLDVSSESHPFYTGAQQRVNEAGLRLNVDVGVQYLESWLRGTGCVPIYNLMEDAATAEISRSQVWQWLHNPKARLDDDRPITADLVRRTKAEVLEQLRDQMGEKDFAAGNYELAAQLFEEISLDERFTDFLTLRAYEYLT